MLKIENNGPEIISPNYWDSDYAKKGYVYLSVNAGAFRLRGPCGKVPDFSRGMKAGL